MWRHTPYGDKYITLILDLTPIRDHSGPSRHLDMIPGRSKKVFKTWLASGPHTWRSRIEIVAKDGITGFKSAAAEELPDAKAVMDPFPRRTPRRQRLGRVPQTHRARTPPPARARHGPPLQGPQGAAHQILPTHTASATPHPRPIRQRLPRHTRSHQERLPEHHPTPTVRPTRAPVRP